MLVMSLMSPLIVSMASLACLLSLNLKSPDELLVQGPRRFLFRHTLGRFQSEEAQFLRAEKHVQELNMSVDLMKKESRKLLERSALAEKDMKRGLSELMSSGNNIHRLAKSVHKVECEAACGFHDFTIKTEEDCVEQKDHEDV